MKTKKDNKKHTPTITHSKVGDTDSFLWTALLRAAETGAGSEALELFLKDNCA